MANSNFVVQNGLTVGPLTIDAATGSISTTGTVSVSGLSVSEISKNNSSITINDTGTGSNISIVIDGTTEHVLTSTLTTLNGNLLVNDVGYLQVPAGTSAQRPGSPSNGMMRYNSTITSFEGYYAGAWSSLGGVKSVDGKAYIQAETSAGAGDDVIRVYAGDSGTSTQVMWASTSNIKILPTTTSTSSTSGALQVAGGVGIAGNLNVGGAFAAANITTSGTSGNISGVNNLSANTLTISGKVQITDATNNSGTNYTTGALQVTGGAGFGGSTYIGGALNVTGHVTVESVTSTGATGTGKFVFDASPTISGTLTTGTILPSANVTYNLGSTTAWWSTIYGKATQAQYADLAENYQGDRQYNPGTVLMFGGTNEVTLATVETTAVAGVVSTNPAHLMNGALNGSNVVALALTGRVPCMVIGPVKKGDLMVSAGFGYAKPSTNPQIGQVIGKALEDYPMQAKGVIEVVVGRL